MTRRWPFFATAFGLALASSGSSAAFVTESQLIFPSPATPYGYFGTATAASGDTLVVGSTGGLFGSETGAVSVYRRSGASFQLEQTLTASDSAPYDRFGYDVAISGDVLVVGMLRSQPPFNGGKAYVFRRTGTTWIEEQILVGSGGVACGDPCSRWVSVSGDVLAVDDTIFRWNGSSWVEEQTLLLPAGYSARGCAVSGSTVLLFGGSFSSESIFVFVWTGTSWVQQAQLIGSGIAPGEAFGGLDGQALAIDGDVALVGAPYDEGTSGTSYVFRRSGTVWSEEQILTGFTGDQFGYSVALGPDVAVVGAFRGDATPGVDDGTAHLFRREAGTWVRKERLVAGADECGLQSLFAFSTALAGDVAFVGAPQQEPVVPNECHNLRIGGAYVYDIPRCGNGALALSEACDDGNTTAGDGCSATCQLEPCNDTTDNDGDGFVDFPADPGCRDAGWTENPACQNGLNDDGQNGIDFDGGASVNGGVPITNADPQCTTASRRSEASSGCGLGAELAVALTLLAVRRRHGGAPKPPR